MIAHFCDHPTSGDARYRVHNLPSSLEPDLVLVGAPGDSYEESAEFSSSSRDFAIDSNGTLG